MAQNIMLVLSKFLALPMYPVGMSLLCIITGMIFLLLTRRRTAIVFLAIGAAVLYASSADPWATAVIRSLEGRYAPAETFPPASAVVLLSGGEVAKNPPRIYDEVNSAGDRIIYAARLMRKDVAPRLIVTGGNISFMREIHGSQAEVAYRLLTETLCVDSSVILLERRARNTRENALFTRRMLDSLGLPPKVILVTSALHMPRSVGLFRKVGCEVYPAPTDYQVDWPRPFKVINIFPSVGKLIYVTGALHEYYGMFYARLRGWL